MSGMDQFLAEIYGTAKTASATDEEVEKTAQLEMFAKLAADENIDLSQMSDDQVAYLFNETFKTAAAQPQPQETTPDEKLAAAQAEFAAKQEWAEKVAEFDYLGRVAAHSYVQESMKIAEAMEKDAASVSETIAKGHAKTHGSWTKAPSFLDKVKSIATGERGRNALKEMTWLKEKGEAATKSLPKKDRELGAALMKQYKGHLHKEVAKGFAPHAAVGAAAVGGAAKGIHHAVKKDEKESRASALDSVALETAVKMASEQGWNTDEVVSRLEAVVTLGLGESEKTASAPDFETAVITRGLEYLEAAGYPVTWAE